MCKRSCQLHQEFIRQTFGRGRQYVVGYRHCKNRNIADLDFGGGGKQAGKEI